MSRTLGERLSVIRNPQGTLMLSYNLEFVVKLYVKSEALY